MTASVGRQRWARLPSLTVLGIFGLISPDVFAQCSPKAVLKIVTVDASPGVDKTSFAAKPKTLYRLGTRFGRLEEEPDPPNQIHGLAVVSHPDVWMVNLLAKTGLHTIDSDTNGVFRSPIFPRGAFGPSFPEVLTELEYGCEVDFFMKHESPPVELRGAEGLMVKQALGTTEWKTVLIRRNQNAPPAWLFLFHDEKIIFTVRYLCYEEVRGDTSGLFRRPDGIAYTETAVAQPSASPDPRP